MTPREAGIQAFYADEGTTNTLQGLNAAFDAYEAVASTKMLLTSLHAELDAIDYHIQEHSFSRARGLISQARYAIRAALSKAKEA